MAAKVALSQPSGNLAQNIASFMVRPRRHLKPDLINGYLSDVEGFDLRQVAQHTSLATAFDHFLAHQSGSIDAEVTTELLSRLSSHGPTAQALNAAFLPWETISRIQRLIIAAVFQKQICGALLKADREAILAFLGPEAQRFALRRAGVFYTNLAELVPSEDGFSVTPKDQPDFDSHPAANFSLGLLIAALTSIAPLAGDILRIRVMGRDLPASVPELLPAHVSEIMTLIQKEATP